MEAQTTPASPPRKVRRLESTTSIPEVPKEPFECLEKADSEDEFSSNVEKPQIQPAERTPSTSTKILEEASQFWENAVSIETSNNYSFTDYISLQEKEGGVFASQDKGVRQLVPVNGVDSTNVFRSDEDGVSVPEDNESSVSVPEDDEGSVSVPEDKEGSVSVPENDEGSVSVPEDEVDGSLVITNEAQTVIDSEVNAIETNTSETELTQGVIYTDSPQDDLDIILDSLGCNETKSKEKLLEECFNNAASRQFTESFFRSAVQTYLLAQGETVYNTASSTDLMNEVNNADFLTIIKIFAGLLKKMDSQLNHSMQSESEPLSENPIVEVLEQIGSQKKIFCTQGTQTDEPHQTNGGSNVSTFIDEMYELHLNKVTASLTDMRAEMHDTDDKKNITACGKIQLKVFFTDQEILDCSVRAQIRKDGTQAKAFDPKRLFVMSQGINFMITEHEDISATKFKETAN